MRPARKLLALALILDPANAAPAGDGPFAVVGVDQAAKLIIGNTVVIDPHPKSADEVARRYYSSLERVYECSKSQCNTHGVQIVDGDICEPDLRGECIGGGGRWFFLKGDLARMPKGAQLGSLVLVSANGRPEVHAILKGNMTGYPDFTIPPGPLEPVTVDAKDALPGTQDDQGQFAARDLGRLFPGNTLINTDGSLDPCLKGAEYYAPDGRLFSLGCAPKENNKVGVDFSIWLLRWRLEGTKFCTTGRMEPNRYVCLTEAGANDAIVSRSGRYPPPSGRLAVQVPSSENAPLLRGNVFHFED